MKISPSFFLHLQRNIPQSTCRVKCIAAVIYRKKLITLQSNQDSHWSHQGHVIPGDHAEVKAVKEAQKIMTRKGKKLGAYSIIVCRIAHTQDGDLTLKNSGIPCKSCSQFLHTHGAKHVFYNQDNEIIEGFGGNHYCSSQKNNQEMDEEEEDDL